MPTNTDGNTRRKISMGEKKDNGVLKGYTKEELMKGVYDLDKSFKESVYKPKQKKEKVGKKEKV